eukprot:6483434-Amphidinium_carterae.1
MAETAALVEALSAAQWIVSWRGFATDEKYERPKSRLMEIELTQIERSATRAPDAILAITDSKSLYDVLHGGNIDGVDKRTGLEMLVCRDVLTTLHGSVRWIPHEANISDSLTKLGAHHAVLLEALQKATICLRAEHLELSERKAYREATGKSNPRPKRSQ